MKWCIYVYYIYTHVIVMLGCYICLYNDVDVDNYIYIYIYMSTHYTHTYIYI